MSEVLRLRVESIARASQGVHLFEFVHPEGRSLPHFGAGAHVDIHMAPGLTRQYSLVNAPGERGCYRIAAQLEPAGRGGSRHMHESLHVGQILSVGQPRNNFPLDPAAPLSVLYAGGIGITPLWSMAQELQAQRRSWLLYYACRDVQRAAFLRPLRSLALPGQLIEVFDGGRREAMLDVAEAVRRQPSEAHLYCCGPAPFIQAFRAGAVGRDPRTVHTECFAAMQAPTGPAATDSAFELVLARSGRSVQVPSGRSALQALREAGVDIASSCESGICGSCETRVLAGQPEHRDQVLSESEREAGRSFLPCVSRCRGSALTLDL